MSKARYEIVIEETTPSALVIRDLGPWDRFHTVTNDVEQVLAELFAAGYLPSTRRLFYYDSEGRKDEILFDQRGRFMGFA
jgi:hypothetical protein